MDSPDSPLCGSFRDPDGNPITAHEWARRFADWNGRILADTRLRGGGHIRTLWLGYLDESDACVRLFGTAFYPHSGPATELGCWPDRSTAIAGHAWCVAVHGAAFFCPVCHWTSANPENLRHGYCRHCQDWTAEPWNRRTPPPVLQSPG